jgi:hypothetical protein
MIIGSCFVLKAKDGTINVIRIMHKNVSGNRLWREK